MPTPLLFDRRVQLLLAVLLAVLALSLLLVWPAVHAPMSPHLLLSDGVVDTIGHFH